MIEFQSEPWREQAACRGADPNLFFPKRGMVPRKAYEVCAGCPVRVECGDYARRVGETRGVWGGRTLGRPMSALRGTERPIRGDLA